MTIGTVEAIVIGLVVFTALGIIFPETAERLARF